LERCNCSRTALTEESGAIKFSDTSCGRDSFNRGNHQKVVAFSFYGNTKSEAHKAKQYFTGIQENLDLLSKIYDLSWTMRLYYDLDDGDPMEKSLCELACSRPQLDLCHVRRLPGNPVQDASSLFAMTWRFLPVLDPQVSVYLSRDLDSRFGKREAAAVEEWLQSGAAVHTMRDHPQHGVPLLGGLWGARITNMNMRLKWKSTWEQMLKDEKTYSPRGSKKHDQDLLKAYVWPWAREVSVQHDSYTCSQFPGSVGFPTARSKKPNNFVGAVEAEGHQLWQQCPKRCRRQHHMDWSHCFCLLLLEMSFLELR